MTLHATWIEFKMLHLIQIQLKINGMQIGAKVLIIYLWLRCWKKKSQNTQIWKNLFPFLFRWELAKHILGWNCPKDNLWNLKLSYLNQFQWLITTVRFHQNNRRMNVKIDFWNSQKNVGHIGTCLEMFEQHYLAKSLLDYVSTIFWHRTSLLLLNTISFIYTHSSCYDMY
jgi:hypothetical protein